MKINISRKFYMFFCLVSLSVFVSCGVPATPISNQSQATDTVKSDTCLPPLYNGFSYSIKANTENQLYPGLNMFVSPPSPWQILTSLPEFIGKTKGKQRNVTVIQTRELDNHLEIWVRISSELNEPGSLAMYRMDTGKWEVIPEQITKLSIDKNGSIWGSHSGSSSAIIPVDNRILSKFNEQTRTFTVVKDVQNLASGVERDGIYYYSDVLLDKDGMFWILVPIDGIYKYNPTTGDVKKFFDLPGTFSDATIAANGTIYVLIHDQFYQDGKLVTQSLLKLYVPETGKVGEFPLVYNLEPYPYPNNILIDTRGRVWLDSVAYIGEDGELYQIQRSPLFLSPVREVDGDYRYKMARIILGSSDGRLWFLHPNNGMIYLDPDKGQWCWFTTYQSNIREK